MVSISKNVFHIIIRIIQKMCSCICDKLVSVVFEKTSTVSIAFEEVRREALHEWRFERKWSFRSPLNLLFPVLFELRIEMMISR